ncbi:MAG: hypothetical protein ACR2JK_15380 [Geodermatophilaceae bacterium]
MIVLITWIVALVAAGLILGIVGFGLAGQLRRLQRAVTLTRADVLPRVLGLIVVAPRKPSAGRHSAEHRANTAG